MSADSTVLADLARVLRSRGWRVSPPAKSVAAVGNPCPTCGHRREPSVRDHALALVGHGWEVSASKLAEVSGCAIGTAHNELSALCEAGLLIRVAQGRYEAPKQAVSR